MRRALTPEEAENRNKSVTSKYKLLAIAGGDTNSTDKMLNNFGVVKGIPSNGDASYEVLGFVPGLESVDFDEATHAVRSLNRGTTKEEHYKHR